jgi:asparagine synthase (glutamine-hydrolysing)
MCGITGYFSGKGIPFEPGKIMEMTHALSHRGPDDFGYFENSGIALGHTRLSIIDLSLAGHQPMTNEDNSLVLIFNGEIYNFEELRSDLKKKGHYFRSNSDSEVILHQYEEDGEECLQKFNGMFAFALWDKNKRSLLLARDRIGKKPLFYFMGSGFIIFGSEIKSLLASDLVVPELCHEALETSMVYNAMAAPMTLFKGIHQLLPGHYLIAGRETSHIRKYWDLRSAVEISPSTLKNEGQWLEAFREKFNRSVALRMRSDAPYGAFLSSGLDSTAIVKAMTEKSEDPVRTFSFGFNDDSFDESTAAKEISKIFGTTHKTVYAEAQNLPQLLETSLYFGEEFTPNPCFIPVYLLCREAAKEVKMVLSGDGADEILAGYETYQATYAAQFYKKLPRLIKEPVSWFINRLSVSNKKVPIENKLKRFVYGSNLPGKECHALWRYIFTPEKARATLVPKIQDLLSGYDPTHTYKQCIKDGESFSFLSNLLYADLSYYLTNDAILKMDRMGMANGLEVRTPFLDHELVEFLFSMPDSLKLKRFFNKKYLLKQYLRKRVPNRLIYQKKAGFNVPVDAWLRGPLREKMLDNLNITSVKSLNIFSASIVTQMVQDHLSGRKNLGLELWNILSFSVWHNLFLQNQWKSKVPTPSKQSPPPLQIKQ